MQIIRWDDAIINVEFTDENDAPVNLTWSTVYFTVKRERDLKKPDDSDALIKKTITEFDNPTAWICEIELDNQETDLAPWDYYYDLQIKSVDGKITSAQKDVLTIIQDVTRDPQLPTEVS